MAFFLFFVLMSSDKDKMIDDIKLKDYINKLSIICITLLVVYSLFTIFCKMTEFKKRKYDMDTNDDDCKFDNPTSVNIIYPGDLLQATDDVIVHQTNCVSTGDAAGIYTFIVKKYPYADVYSRRTPSNNTRYADRDSAGVPGGINVDFPNQDSAGCPIVIGINGQYAGGKSVDEKNYKYAETHKMREEWFRTGLINLKNFITDFNAIAMQKNMKKITTVGFPYNIGCGVAGGKWENYYNMIFDFAKDQTQFIVNIYRIPDPAETNGNGLGNGLENGLGNDQGNTNFGPVSYGKDYYYSNETHNGNAEENLHPNMNEAGDVIGYFDNTK